MRSPLPAVPFLASSSGDWSGLQLLLLLGGALVAGLVTGRVVKARRRRAEAQVFGQLPPEH